MDGPAAGRTFWRIILPMCKPIIISTVRAARCSSPGTSTCSRWSSPAATGLQTLPVGLTSLMSKNGTEFPVVFAGMVIAAVPVVLLFVFGQRYIVKGLADGIGK